MGAVSRIDENGVIWRRLPCPMVFSSEAAIYQAAARRARLFEDLHDFFSAIGWKRSHQTVTSTCCVSIVKGIPRSALTSRQAAIASRILSSASSRLLP
jgi:hypothetical protein